MRYKRARVMAELAAEAKAAKPGATDDEIQAEVQRRAAALREKGLLIEQWNLEDIGADLGRCGLAGSPTKVFRVQSIVLTKAGYTDVPPTEDGIRNMIHELVIDRTLG
jgi:electron transfer flavoprotein beta subunit